MATDPNAPIRFLLGHEPRAVTGMPPTMTVLEYLRRVERLTGTKEGCAEGDCGACTVTLAEPDGKGGLRVWPVNACIQFLPALHGRQLIAVEHVADGDGGLHPVQKALVDHHGSQCGFCTPGFVMQIYAGWRANAVAGRAGLKDWLAGNLCRCTGYGPILDAGMEALAKPADGEGDAATVEALQALDDGKLLKVESGDQLWFTPRSLDELAKVYAAHPDAVLVSGATDVGLWVTKQHRTLRTLIDVTRIPALREVRDGRATIRIGAAVTHQAALPALAAVHSDLGELMRRFASVQIRSAGTVGGNIANGSPIGDLPPALIALGARLALRSATGSREIRLEDFFIDYGKQDRAPGEFVEAAIVPKLAENARFACYKISKRFDQDISAVMAALAVELDGETIASARIAFGGMAATPKRAKNAEAALTRQLFGKAAFEAAAEALARDFTPITDMRASDTYRMTVAQNLVRRFWLEQGEKVRTRVLEAG